MPQNEFNILSFILRINIYYWTWLNQGKYFSTLKFKLIPELLSAGESPFAIFLPSVVCTLLWGTTLHKFEPVYNNMNWKVNILSIPEGNIQTKCKVYFCHV